MNMNLVRWIDKYLVAALICIFVFMKKVKRILFSFFASPILKNTSANKEIQPSHLKILVIKFWGMGNFIMLLPTLQKIRNTFPAAKIYILTLEKNREIIEKIPYIDESIFLDTQGWLNFLATSLKVLSYIRKIRLHIVFDFEQFAKVSSLLSYLCAADDTVGFKTKGQFRHFLYTTQVSYTNDKHMMFIFSDIISAKGIDCSDILPIPIKTTEREKQVIAEFLNNAKITSLDTLIGMHVGSGNNFIQRRWRYKNFAEVADKLIEKYRVKIIFTGIKEEVRLVENTIEIMKYHNETINICGKYKFGELAAIIKRCYIFFSNDTGPLHLAAAMGVNTVGFYGPNTPLLYGPFGANNLTFYKTLNCSPCITNMNSKDSNCVSPICMTSISVAEVLEKVDRKYFS